jgi:hypothetical protein
VPELLELLELLEKTSTYADGLPSVMQKKFLESCGIARAPPNR